MEKELKIAELASIWNVSVPTTWNRIKKMGLTTFIKKNETNKDVNYVNISDEQINEYIINVNNNVNKDVSNGYYEDMLINNNVNNGIYNPNVPALREFSVEDLKDVINTITTVNNDYNNRFETLTNRLITAESKQLLLEDKASREGIYINEINELKIDNKGLQRSLSIFKYLFITVTVVLLMLITVLITVNKLNTQSAQSGEIVEQPLHTK